MALIDKETIRAEIERRKIVYRSSENLQDAIRYDEITELLNFIDSLPEQPVTDCHELEQGLEEAAEEYTRSEYSSPCAFGGENIEEWVSRIFIAGAEWQKEQKMKEGKARFLKVLDQWEEHAIRGMRGGATAYHQGKIALITDLRDWINREG